MKKIVLGILFIGIILTVSTNVGFAVSDSFGAVTFEELEASEPAILAGNPFHFLKDVRWRVESLFVSDIENMAFERKILAEKAAEIKKIDSLRSSEEVLLSALSEYQTALITHKLAGKKILEDDIEFNEGGETLIQLLIHLRLIDEICQNRLSGEGEAVLLNVQTQLAENFNFFVNDIVGSTNSLNILKEYIEDRGILAQLRDAEILILFSNLLEGGEDFNFSLASLAGDVMDRTTDWLLSLSGSERSNTGESLASMAGRSTLRGVFLD